MMDDKKPDLSPLVMRGRTMVSQGRTDDAIGIYSDVIKIDPNHAMAHADRGTAYAMTSKLDLAKADLEKSFALGYKEPSAFSTAGTVSMQLKDYPKALDYFGKALKLDPKYAFAYYNRSKALHEVGDNKGAVEDLETCLKLKPDDGMKKLVNDRLAMLRPLVKNA
jgi:lipoprotein NlpI